MSRSMKTVLSEKKGIADVLGLIWVGMAMIVAVGLVVGNYAILSRQASQLQTLGQEVTSRAELYAATLNKNLSAPEIPAMTRTCSTKPSVCTTILSATPSADGQKTVLRIQGDFISGVGQSITRDLTLVSSDVTHVTSVDANGDKSWARSDEGLHYRIWGLASGEPASVDPADVIAPQTGATWLTVTDRAGIDSTGKLWVWGKNNIGQAGIGSAGSAAVAPRKVAGTTNFRSVVTADDRAYAIDSRGDLWVWGKNTKGQLGLGHANQVMVPTKIANARVMSVAVGKDNVFMLGMDGSLSVAGASQTGFPANSGFQPQVLTPGTKYRAVAASSQGAVATIDSAGKLSLYGNSYPFTPLAGGVFTSVALGETAGYAIGTDARVYVWGQGSSGQLGLGSVSSANTPTQLRDVNAVAVSAAKTSAFVIETSGRLFYMGKTPAGTTSGPSLPQVNVPTSLLRESRFRDVAANSGDTSVALLDTASNVYGMGTATPGLWPMNYQGAGDQPIRMPALEGFAAYVRK